MSGTTDTGWIKLHRRFLKSAIWQNPNIRTFWVWALLKAGHAEHVVTVGFKRVTLHPGQFLYNHPLASMETGMSQKVVRSCLDFLKSGDTPEIGQAEGSFLGNRYSIITINNWALYQGGNSDEGRQRAGTGVGKGQAEGSLINRKKNVKNEKNSSAITFATAEPPTSRPSAAAERESAAARIDALYRKSVPNPYNRKLSPKKSIPRIVAILKSGVSEEALTGAVERYAKEAAKAPPDKRKGIRGFFSPRDGMWEGYVADDGEDVADGYIDPDDDTWEASPQMLSDYEDFCRQNRERDGLMLIDGKLVKKGDAHEHGDAVAGTA